VTKRKALYGSLCCPLKIQRRKKENTMKLSKIAGFVFIALLLPAASYAIGFEVAVSGWYPSPQGEISYNPIDAGDVIDLEDDLGYEDTGHISGRAKLEIPIIPNIYLMATPLEFDDIGTKDIVFNFGETTFSAGVDLQSTLTLNMYDVGLYYDIPFLELASSGVFSVELGLNARIFDATVTIEQASLEESEDYVTGCPLAYIGVRVSPIDSLAFEAEARGVTYSDITVLSAIGRVKLSPFGPLFVAGGYRYELLDIEIQDVVVDAQFCGPFAEVGIQF
jgi:outer membrane protein